MITFLKCFNNEIRLRYIAEIFYGTWRKKWFKIIDFPPLILYFIPLF